MLTHFTTDLFVTYIDAHIVRAGAIIPDINEHSSNIGLVNEDRSVVGRHDFAQPTADIVADYRH